MDWIQIGSAVLLGAMAIFLFPRAKDAIKNSPKGSSSDWMGFLIPVVVIVGFITLLVNML